MGIQILRQILKEESFKREDKLSNIKLKTILSIKIGSPPEKDPNFILKKGAAILTISLSMIDTEEKEKIAYEASYVIDYKTEESMSVENFNDEIFKKISNDVFTNIETTLEKAGLKDYKLRRFNLDETTK